MEIPALFLSLFRIHHTLALEWHKGAMLRIPKRKKGGREKLGGEAEHCGVISSFDPLTSKEAEHCGVISSFDPLTPGTKIKEE